MIIGGTTTAGRRPIITLNFWIYISNVGNSSLAYARMRGSSSATRMEVLDIRRSVSSDNGDVLAVVVVGFDSIAVGIIVSLARLRGGGGDSFISGR